MSKIVTIEDALSRINGDIFQDFCNDFLYLKLNPNTINPIGSVIGKEKSRKGTPDSYFTIDNELIFAEYTTRERLKTGQSFYKKLESDINHCFDTSKTKLEKNQVDRVILCFTERIKPDEKIKLEKLCKSHNSNCILELIGIRSLAFGVLDYPSLGDYLGVKIGTGQIQEPSEFITNYEKRKISTPLSNIFLGREKEIEIGLNRLESTDLFLAHGAPGTGKSKFAIELSKLYADKNDYHFLCIGNKGLSIWEDLKTTIRTDKKYLLLVDDANRLAQNFQLILSLFEDREANSLKVIVTVRDYALSQVKDIASDFNSESIEIGLFSNDEIEKIIKSDDFRITEPSYVDRILKIAQGNARLAIMSAKVALNTKNILELSDASQIYDEYFEPLFKEVELLREPIVQKSLALISFFSLINKDNRELCDPIFEKLNIEESKFWEICYELHEAELVDLFEHQIVKISDQIFSTYIFYKTVIENEVLSFNFFLNNYLDYESRIKDTIIPVINTFNYKHIEKKLKPLIFTKWLDIEKKDNNQESLRYLDLFWFYLDPQVLNFLKKQIDTQSAKTASEYRYSYESNEFSNGTEKDLEILSRFRYLRDESFKDALELMFYSAINVTSKMPAVIYTFVEKFNFSRFDYRQGNRIQHLLFDFLIKNAKNGQNCNIYENALAEILPNFLKIQYRDHESDGKRQMILHTFHIWLSPAVKSFRDKCFNYLLKDACKPTVLKVLYRLDYYEYKHSDDILQHDLTYIYQIINKHFNPNESVDCFVLQNIIEHLDWLKVDYSSKIKKEYKSKLYKLTEILKLNRYRKVELGWREEEKLHEKELIDYCISFNKGDYEKLLQTVYSMIKDLEKLGFGSLEQQYEKSLNTIVANTVDIDGQLFLDVLELNFKSFDFNLNYDYIFNCFSKKAPQSYLELFDLIKSLDTKIRFCFHKALNIDCVNDEHLSLLYLDCLNSIKSLKSQYFFWDLTFISKYKNLKKEKEIYLEVIKTVLNKIKKEERKISVGKPFFEKCLLFSDFPLDLIVETYLYSNNFEQHFDYDRKLFKEFLKRNPNVIIQFLKFNFSDKNVYHDLDHKNYDVIWELENSEEIIDSIFEYFMTNVNYYGPEHDIAGFFPEEKDKHESKPVKYLRNIIDEKHLDDKYMQIVFYIIADKYSELSVEFLERFLKLNNNIEAFKNLRINETGGASWGSYITVLEKEKKVWEALIPMFDNLPNRLDYCEHKEYVNNNINVYDLRIKEEMKREFYEDFR